MIKQVEKFLKNYNLLEPKNILLVGFSGGVDSLCLLDILFKLSQEYKFSLVAAHLNHNWRGIESKIEEDNARAYCEARNITFYSEILPKTLPHTELEARNQRYSFFNRASAKFNATAILTGHTLSDQVETVLYRIIKGTGLTGLKGIPEVRYQDDFPAIYRPLLEISRNETLNYCQENNLRPNIDASNLRQDFLRNKIRLSLIPELRTYNSNIEDAIIRLSTISKDSEALINEYLDEIKSQIYINNDEIDTKKFLNLSNPTQKRILLDFLLKNKIEYNFEKIDEIFNFIQKNFRLKSGNTLSLAENSWLFASSKIIKLIYSIKANKSALSVIVNLNGETCHPELGKILKIAVWKGHQEIKYPDEFANIAYVDLSRVNKPIYLRTMHAGDKIQPFGMNEKMKLKKYLINKAVPEFERAKLPVLATDSEVLWVVGVGISELLRVTGIPSHILEVN